MAEETPFLSLAGLIDASVRHRGITLGHVVDVRLDAALERAVGLELLCPPGDALFLAWPTFELEEEAIEVPRPLSLLSETELDYYRASGLGFRELVGRQVTRGGAPVGTLADVLVANGGELGEIRLDGGRDVPA